jgi:hypothetical protein
MASESCGGASNQVAAIGEERSYSVDKRLVGKIAKQIESARANNVGSVKLERLGGKSFNIRARGPSAADGDKCSAVLP